SHARSLRRGGIAGLPGGLERAQRRAVRKARLQVHGDPAIRGQSAAQADGSPARAPAASEMSAAEEVSGTDPAGEWVAFTGAPRQLGSVAACLGLGILAASLAQSQSASYDAQESSALRATAHSTVPFFVAASVLADRVGPRAALPFRSAFVGAHVVHIGQIALMLRDHGTGEPLIR